MLLDEALEVPITERVVHGHRRPSAVDATVSILNLSVLSETHYADGPLSWTFWSQFYWVWILPCPIRIFKISMFNPHIALSNNKDVALAICRGR